jgi:hypothetical protein
MKIIQREIMRIEMDKKQSPKTNRETESETFISAKNLWRCSY